MTTTLRELLTLEPLEINLFRGRSPKFEGYKRIYGGQVIAQALMAAYGTVEERICHSLHCYFIRPGDITIPIIFEVDRARDGKSFTTRRVVAIQNGQQIFNLAASFQVAEAGIDHQAAMGETAAPETYPDLDELADHYANVMPGLAPPRFRRMPLEMRYVDPPIRAEGDAQAMRTRAWFRLTEDMGGNVRLQQAALAFCSDFGLLRASLAPHRLDLHTPGLQTASLDHAMWFHRPTDVSQWHLYDMTSPSASGARGFAIGSLHRQDGTLVASCAQEGLVRQHEAGAP